MIIKLLTEHYLEFLSLKGGCRGSSESTPVKMPHCWKSHATTQIVCDSDSWFLGIHKGRLKFLYVQKESWSVGGHVF